MAVLQSSVSFCDFFLTGVAQRIDFSSNMLTPSSRWYLLFSSSLHQTPLHMRLLVIALQRADCCLLSLDPSASVHSVSMWDVRHTFKWDKVFPLSPYPILTKLGGNLPGQVPQIKFEDKLERSKVKVTEVKFGKSHFGPFDPFKVHRLQRNRVWTSSATFVKFYYTGFDLRSKVKVTEVKFYYYHWWPL